MWMLILMGQHTINQGSKGKKQSLLQKIVRAIPQGFGKTLSACALVYAAFSGHYLRQGYPLVAAAVRPAVALVQTIGLVDDPDNEGPEEEPHWTPIIPPPETYKAKVQQGFIRRLMTRHKRSYHDRSKLESLLALSEFTTQKPTMKAKQSVQAIDKHLIQVKSDEGNCSGELITTDGWFISAYHCFDTNGGTKARMTSILVGDKEYEIEIGAYHYPGLDLAVAKADIPERARPIKMNIFNTEQIKLKQAVRIHGYRDGLVYRQLGKVTTVTYHPTIEKSNGDKKRYDNCFQTSALSTPGHSGGVTIDHSTGGLMGVNSSYRRSDSGDRDKDGVGPGTSAKMNDVLHLINGVVKLEVDKEYNIDTGAF